MYSLNDVDEKYYKYKERVILYKSFENLITCHNAGIKNVACIRQDEYNQSIRYRIDNIADVIDMIEDWNAIVLRVCELQMLRQYVEFLDLVIIHRTFHNEICEFIDLFRNAGVKIIFDIDDYTFHKKCLYTAVWSTPVPYDMRKEMIEQYYKLEKMSDGLSTSTMYLKTSMERFFTQKVFYYRNHLSMSEHKAAEDFFNQKKSLKQMSCPFTLAFISGSSGHNKDFLMISGAIYRILKNPNVTLKIVGYLKIPFFLRRYLDNGQLYILKFTDPITLIKEISETDLLLVPLCSNRFSKGRSEIKYFLASSVGTPVIASPRPVYREIENKGLICHLCKFGRWYQTIKKMITEPLSIESRQIIQRDGINEYGFYSQISQMKKTLSEMMDA